MAARTSIHRSSDAKKLRAQRFGTLVGRFFRNSHEALVLNILQDAAIDPEELKRLRKMLERSNAK